MGKTRIRKFSLNEYQTALVVLSLPQGSDPGKRPKTMYSSYYGNKASQQYKYLHPECIRALSMELTVGEYSS